MPTASQSSQTVVQEPEHQFVFQPITENFVLNQLKSLKTNKAIGLDNISARLIKDASVVICDQLTCLYNRSLQSAVFPNIWKMGKVTALFKSGSRLDANNYRPITVLPTLSKILEKAVHSQVYGFLKTNELLSPNQFGFREKLSTAVALARFMDTILDNTTIMLPNTTKLKNTTPSHPIMNLFSTDSDYARYLKALRYSS